MFLNKNYILSNELLDKTDISLVKISMLRKQFEDADDFTTIVKMNNCNFIKSDSQKLPKDLRKGIESNEFIDFSNKLPCSWVRDEFQVKEEELFKSGIIINKVVLHKKKFYVFSDDFINKVKNRIPYILNREDTQKCYQKGQIEGYIELSKNKFMTWYNPRDY